MPKVHNPNHDLGRTILKENELICFLTKMAAKVAFTATVRAVKAGKFIPHKAPLTLVSIFAINEYILFIY